MRECAWLPSSQVLVNPMLELGWCSTSCLQHSLAPVAWGLAVDGQNGVCQVLNLVWCVIQFCTYPALRASAALARVTFARMSEALAVQMNGLGLAL